jgi:fructose-1,6-bisphosphatase/inositol monophosphatase family enzyme
MTYDISELLGPIQRLHNSIQASVVEACVRAEPGDLFRIDRDDEGDTIYAVDRISEELLIEFFEQEIASDAPLVLIAEGIQQGRLVLPRGIDERDAVWRIIVDPIDGTRALMYQKRSAWILTGVAPNRGPHTGLKDIELAVQTEIPLVKQHLADSLWAIRDRGAGAERFNRLTGERTPIRPCPSKADTIAHGFAMVARFFPGAREELAAIDEEIITGALGPVRPGKAHCFEDQYLSSAGQLYELMAGHDRFIADLRPLMERLLARQGKALGICCHPYDLCTELIARELGVIVTSPAGEPLDAELSTEPDDAWVGYANKAIRAQIEPLLHEALRRRGLIDSTA